MMSNNVVQIDRNFGILLWFLNAMMISIFGLNMFDSMYWSHMRNDFLNTPWNTNGIGYYICLSIIKIFPIIE